MGGYRYFECNYAGERKGGEGVRKSWRCVSLLTSIPPFSCVGFNAAFLDVVFDTFTERYTGAHGEGVLK